MSEDAFEKIRSFVSEFRRVRKNKLSLDTDIYKLGLDGDDAREFMEAFGFKFGVDMTEFEFSKHFGAEGFNPFYFLYCLLFDRKKLHRIPITLRDLTEAAKNMKWPKK